MAENGNGVNSGAHPSKPVSSLEELVMPRRPAGIPYSRGEDYDARALLVVNGHKIEAKALAGLLSSDLGVLGAAAARTLGANQDRTAIPALKSAAQNSDLEETVQVQAAYALARMGVEGSQEILAKLLEIDPRTTSAPLLAAGALARLGDPRGFGLVRAALESDNRVTAMVACKQLFYFAPLDGKLLPEGGSVQVYEAFRSALARPEEMIVGEARAQLEALDTTQARRLLDG